MIGAYDMSVAADVMVVTGMRFCNSRLRMMIGQPHGWITLLHRTISMALGRA
jgi:hypothetical protein